MKQVDYSANNHDVLVVQSKSHLFVTADLMTVISLADWNVTRYCVLLRRFTTKDHANSYYRT